MWREVVIDGVSACNVARRSDDKGGEVNDLQGAFVRAPGKERAREIVGGRRRMSRYVLVYMWVVLDVFLRFYIFWPPLIFDFK